MVEGGGEVKSEVKASWTWIQGRRAFSLSRSRRGCSKGPTGSGEPKQQTLPRPTASRSSAEERTAVRQF